MIVYPDMEKSSPGNGWKGLIAFLRALCSIYERGKVQAPNVHVKYAQDEQIYVNWTPRRQSDIEASGLRDPGFGPGPLYYADLDLVEVRLSDWVAQKGEAGRADFAYLLETLAGSPDLELGHETVLWKKR
ncbi:hypothetical protein QE424_000826 [Stenotrophomonas rhizophila]|uniref:Uncharacterized protein n=1 Tax=Stenotrophomonas rhizophila TaxID=216778 RepID=A0AAP5AEZ5_9GAMM|nr:hypothetical protein [Stenotrophomonas rhizophila]MDQ1107667.1 hypothetical protein [Stenotrophomonas rhizophila]